MEKCIFPIKESQISKVVDVSFTDVKTVSLELTRYSLVNRTNYLEKEKAILENEKLSKDFKELMCNVISYSISRILLEQANPTFNQKEKKEKTLTDMFRLDKNVFDLGELFLHTSHFSENVLYKLIIEVFESLGIKVKLANENTVNFYVFNLIYNTENIEKTISYDTDIEQVYKNAFDNIVSNVNEPVDNATIKVKEDVRKKIATVIKLNKGDN